MRQPLMSRSSRMTRHSVTFHDTAFHKEDGAEDKPGQGSGTEIAGEAWLDDKDDYVSAITAERYFQTRVQPLIALYKQNAPILSHRLRVSNILVFFLSFVASVLGAFQHSIWIPAVVGLSSMLSTLYAFHVIKGELSATNGALAVLKRQEWNGVLPAMSTAGRPVSREHWLQLSKIT